ncbi:MAG: hypothetical protein Q9167_005927 [Letrouitia subvulpina]
MSFAKLSKIAPFTPNPLFGGTWKEMSFRAGQNILICAHLRSMGGYSIVNLDNFKPVPQAVIYVYASGSWFERRMNMYMRTSEPIVIPGWRPEMGLGGNMTVSESAYPGSATDHTAAEATVATSIMDAQQGEESTSATTLAPTVEAVQAE